MGDILIHGQMSDEQRAHMRLFMGVTYTLNHEKLIDLLCRKVKDE